MFCSQAADTIYAPCKGNLSACRLGCKKSEKREIGEGVTFIGDLIEPDRTVCRCMQWGSEVCLAALGAGHLRVSGVSRLALSVLRYPLSVYLPSPVLVAPFVRVAQFAIFALIRILIPDFQHQR